MSDLISRQAAIDAVKKRADKARDMVGSDHPFWEGLIVALDIVEQLPSAQPEIIRCKDCIYYRWEIDMCDYPYATAHNVVHEDDYCSRAERKTDEQTDRCGCAD